LNDLLFSLNIAEKSFIAFNNLVWIGNFHYEKKLLRCTAISCFVNTSEDQLKE